MAGRLLVKCLKGVDLKARQGMFGPADPSCKLRIGTQEFNTRHHLGGGENPVWNEEFGFDISNEKDLEVEVLGKETVGNDQSMGRCQVSIMEWIASGRFEGDLDLVNEEDQPVGRVTIAVEFERSKPGGEDGNDTDKQLIPTGDGGGGRTGMTDPVPSSPSAAADPEEVKKWIEKLDALAKQGETRLR
jgi:Ca2+-dependent lipid-binding protein